ncbi:holo-ACP synthase [Asticcacaulis endophyticus]|uniref:Holo-[acyl-carrier-protein] synthase n=1 Tax=Asticcacaulis endophyticus TaxID=1395890 RepID=A0A918QFB1_9CAUL|nr:holo-[acyl-carrier-protein] synthase [Asticcacaulis endophyticus]
MIVGIGCDLLFVQSIRRSLAGLGDDYKEFVFTDEERTLAEQSADPGLMFARAFCGKEACSKALGTGLTEDILLQDIEILGTKAAPILRLSGGATERLTRMVPAGLRPNLKLCFSGDRTLLQAFVIITAIEPFDS